MVSFTCQAISASRWTPSGLKSRVTPSVASKAAYWRVRHASVLVRMRSKSCTESDSSSTRIGNRPCSSGIRSDGFDRWKAPLPMNRMWSVRIIPYLVVTVVPSTSGSRSRCTPWRETSAPWVSVRLAILSISSRNTMPLDSTFSTARALRSSSFSSRPASSSASSRSASRTFSFRGRRLAPPMFWNMPWICSVRSSMPGGARISIFADGICTSSSISLSSSSPSRSFLRNFWRVALSRSSGSAASVPKPMPRADGNRASSTRSSAASSARGITFFISCSRVCLTAASTRSRMIESTSRPT